MNDHNFYEGGGGGARAVQEVGGNGARYLK